MQYQKVMSMLVDVIEQSGQAYVVRGIGLLNNINEIKK